MFASLLTRKTVKLHLLAFVLVATCLCSAQSQPKHHGATEFRNNMLNIVYIGDSITMSASMPDRDTQAPPATSTTYLKGHLVGTQIFFSNMGRNGHTTKDFLPESEIDFPDTQTAAANMQNGHDGTLLFSIMLGTNDSANRGPNGSPATPQAYTDNLKTIITTLLQKHPGALFVIHHPIWYAPNTENAASYLQTGLDRLQSYNPAIKSMVKSLSAQYPGQIFEGDTQAFKHFEKNHRALLYPENGKQGVFYLHPNQKGAKVLGEFWAKAILKDLKQR